MSETQWHYSRGDQPVGPVSREELSAMIAAGQVRQDDLVWTEGMAQWQPARTLSVLQSAPLPPAGAAILPYHNPGPLPPDPVYAGFWLRFLAHWIDGMVLIIPMLILYITIIGPIIGLWLYFALMESNGTQATLGKMALGLKVTDLQGGRLSFGQATGRFFGKWISGMIMDIGFMMAGWTQKKQALHDMMAGALVVRK
jgi:uncharacterized RDD family membrane protein YckC